MSTVVCSICEKRETECDCDKYCSCCQSQYGIRMAVDGQYYCPECRDACELSLAESQAHE